MRLINRKKLIYSTHRYWKGERAHVGGFADRLKGIIFAYFLAKITNRDFYIEWKDPFEIESIFRPNGVDWRSGCIDTSNAKIVDMIDSNMNQKRELISLGAGEVEKIFGNSDCVKIHCNSLEFETLANMQGLSDSIAKILKSKSEMFYSLFDELFSYDGQCLFKKEWISA